MPLKNNYTLKEGYTNRRYNGIIVLLPIGYEITGIPIVLSVRQAGRERIVATFLIGNGIEILSDLSFKFSLEKLEIAAGSYEYDILIQFPQNPVSWVSGTWEINETVSRTV